MNEQPEETTEFISAQDIPAIRLMTMKKKHITLEEIFGSPMGMIVLKASRTNPKSREQRREIKRRRKQSRQDRKRR